MYKTIVLMMTALKKALSQQKQVFHVFSCCNCLKLIGFCSCFFLIACSQVKGPDGFLRDSNADFAQTYSVPPLKTPPGLKPIPNDPYYEIKGATSIEKVAPVSLKPPMNEDIPEVFQNA